MYVCTAVTYICTPNARSIVTPAIMAQGARLIITEDVLDELKLGDDFDDLDELMMPRE